MDLSHADAHWDGEVTRNPYHVSTWVNYVEFKKNSGCKNTDLYAVYERAVRHLPRSYKLWRMYLADRTSHLENKRVTDRRLELLADAYERALVHLHKMPRIWLDYCDLLVSMLKGTRVRHAFDRALQSLPITQHRPVWDLYVPWAREFGVPETAVRVYRRYLMYEPSRREDFVSYLEGIGQHGEAARQLVICLDDESYASPSGSTRHQLWMQLCDICANHPDEVYRILNVEGIMRSGIATFSDEVGRLWCRLADFYIRLGLFDRARDVYEEAISSVVTVKDFTIVFDAYVKVEETIVTTRLSLDEEQQEEGDGETDQEDVDLSLARLEALIEKRPLLLNSVVLRQNPHNVHEWIKRVKLVRETSGGSPDRAVSAYVEAVRTVDPQMASGKLSNLWISFAGFYEKQKDLKNAASVYSRAAGVDFRSVEELAGVYCAWGEFELRHGRCGEALRVLQRAVEEPPSSAQRRRAQAAAEGRGVAEALPAADKLHRNGRVWSFLLDLEESLGSVESVRKAYRRCIDLKVVTPSMMLNLASYFEEHDFFEDSFRAYEEAVSLFQYPHVKELWFAYIDKFIARYEGSKIERLRDIFEQALKGVPEECAAEVYLRYCRAEERFGLVRHAMAVLDRGCRAVPERDRLDFYRLYIKKVEKHYGVTKTRPLFDRAIAELSDDMARELCVDYAKVEQRLGEVDRARAIFRHGSQYADPRRDPGYWKLWRGFEEDHGNEETFREMLRIERSIQIANSQVNYVSSSISDPSGAAFVRAGGGAGAGGIDGMAAAAEAAVGRKRALEGAFAVSGSEAVAADFGREIDIDSEEVASAVPPSLYGNMMESS